MSSYLQKSQIYHDLCWLSVISRKFSKYTMEEMSKLYLAGESVLYFIQTALRKERFKEFIAEVNMSEWELLNRWCLSCDFCWFEQPFNWQHSLCTMKHSEWLTQLQKKISIYLSLDLIYCKETGTLLVNGKLEIKRILKLPCSDKVIRFIFLSFLFELPWRESCFYVKASDIQQVTARSEDIKGGDFRS